MIDAGPAARACWPRTTPARRPGTSSRTSGSPQETPFTFARVRAAHRPGDAARELRAQPRARQARRCSSSTTGSPPTRSRARRDAGEVNAYEPLLRRARECERIRDHLPNLVAVNFYKRGDVFRVVDTLNGVG